MPSSSHTSLPHLYWYKNRRALQGLESGTRSAGQIPLVPLSSYGKRYVPSAGQIDANNDMKAGLRDQVDHMNIVAYFTLKSNPPTAEDAPMVAYMAKAIDTGFTLLEVAYCSFLQ